MGGDRWERFALTNPWDDSRGRFLKISETTYNFEFLEWLVGKSPLKKDSGRTTLWGDSLERPARVIQLERTLQAGRLSYHDSLEWLNSGRQRRKNAGRGTWRGPWVVLDDDSWPSMRCLSHENHGSEAWITFCVDMLRACFAELLFDNYDHEFHMCVSVYGNVVSIKPAHRTYIFLDIRICRFLNLGFCEWRAWMRPFHHT